MTRHVTAVIGGGCSGVLAARELVRHTDNEVVLLEPGRPGRGVAYGTTEPWHLLNSRAGAMSADPDTEGEFVEWCREHGTPVTPDSFVPRRTYGDYLGWVLDQTAAAAAGRLHLRSARATRVVQGEREYTVHVDTGPSVRATSVVVAVGHPDPARPGGVAEALDGHPAYVRDPWAPAALDRVPRSAPVLLIGCGLTAVDALLALAHTGQTAPVTMVSRHGLLPQAHDPRRATPTAGLAEDVLPDPPSPVSLRNLAREVRTAVDGCGDWRTVVDALRPSLDRLWAGLSPADQQRFLRHLGRLWEVHRHRMAPAIAAEVTRLRHEGRVRVRADSLRAVRVGARSTLEVTFRNGTQETFGAVVNCAGPGRLPTAATGFVRTLLADGRARVGPYGLGLDVDACGRLVDRTGRAEAGVWVVGPLRRGRFWETTAVPEIRAQARSVASRLAGPATAGQPATPANLHFPWT